jgi:hypothetical protein
MSFPANPLESVLADAAGAENLIRPGHSHLIIEGAKAAARR